MHSSSKVFSRLRFFSGLVGGLGIALVTGCSDSSDTPPAAGASGTSGAAGSAGISGSSGAAGTAGTAGVAGAAGSAGSAGASAAGGTGGTGGTVTAPPDKIDLLIVVDNSRSMADKQQLLAAVVPDLLQGLLNPACLDDMGATIPADMQPSSTGQCPDGTHRDFPPILDVHIGFLSSSLGGYGTTSCPVTETQSCGGTANTSNNDRGHLISRTDPCSSTVVPTYQNSGFLDWDPAMKLTPPGESTLGDATSTGLVKSVRDIVIGDGQIGCGFEAQNESWYRFLVDPNPYGTISLVNSLVQTDGSDTSLLQQRAAFLRPDSLLAIVELSDENDTSIKESSSYPLFAQTQALAGPGSFHLPHARQECSTNGPNDPCCASCGQAPPSGCPADPGCTSSPSYSDADENVSLRAFGLTTHKERYGIEFFYPPSRYVQALTSEMINDGAGNTVPNPIFAGGQRTKDWVFYAAITGVPWQLISRQKDGVPDLTSGVSTLDATAVGGFKTAAELSLNDPGGSTFWDDIVGDPEHYIAPKSPYMQESTVPRSGTDPITGIAISPSNSPNDTNAINGHEREIASPADDIEYACIFTLPTPRDCSQPGVSCDCSELGEPTTNPLCDPNPNQNGNFSLQSRGKAYPGLKHLAIAKGLGNQGIVASICAKQVSDPTQADYGYRPAVTTIVNGLKKTIRGK